MGYIFNPSRMLFKVRGRRIITHQAAPLPKPAVNLWRHIPWKWWAPTLRWPCTRCRRSTYVPGSSSTFQNIYNRMSGNVLAYWPGLWKYTLYSLFCIPLSRSLQWESSVIGGWAQPDSRECTLPFLVHQGLSLKIGKYEVSRCPFISSLKRWPSLSCGQPSEANGGTTSSDAACSPYPGR